MRYTRAIIKTDRTAQEEKSYMALLKEQKEVVMGDNKTHDTDTGSPGSADCTA